MTGLDVVVVSYERRDLLLRCLASVGAQAPDARIVVVDNASRDDSPDAARAAAPRATVIALADNLGFAAAANRGVAAGTEPWVLLLNPDAELQPGAVQALLRRLESDARGAAAGPRIRDEDRQLELSVGRTMSLLNDAAFKVLGTRPGRALLSGAIERRYGRSRPVDSLSGACVLLRRSAWEEVGGMDETFFLYAEDVDLCLRLRAAGWRLHYVAEADVRHVRGASASLDPDAARAHYRRSQRRFYEKHRSAWQRTLLQLWHRIAGSAGEAR